MEYSLSPTEVEQYWEAFQRKVAALSEKRQMFCAGVFPKMVGHHGQDPIVYFWVKSPHLQIGVDGTRQNATMFRVSKLDDGSIELLNQSKKVVDVDALIESYLLAPQTS